MVKNLAIYAFASCLLYCHAFSLSPTLSRWERELGQARPLDSFSLREKVAAGQMRVKSPVCFFAKFTVLSPGKKLRLGKICPEIGAHPNAAREHLEIHFFVGRMEVVVRQREAKQISIDL